MELVPTMLRKAVGPLDAEPSKQSHAYGRGATSDPEYRASEACTPGATSGIDVLPPSSLGITGLATQFNGEGWDEADLGQAVAGPLGRGATPLSVDRCG